MHDDQPATLKETLERDPAPVDDEVVVLLKLSRRNLRALTEGGLPVTRIALKESDEDMTNPIGQFRMAAEGGRAFKDALPVRR